MPDMDLLFLTDQSFDLNKTYANVKILNTIKTKFNINVFEMIDLFY